MEEYKITGIVIYATDYKEKDKLITIFSLELGKISAVLKGVKNKDAKLKFAGQLFCFAEFILVKRGTYYTIINADQIESFYSITNDYSRFLVASAVIEIIDELLKPGVIYEKLFLNTLKCFKSLAYDESAEPNTVLIKFLLYAHKISGYAISFDRCNECNVPLISDAYFNFELGFITCKNCSGNYCSQVSKKSLNILKFINNATLENLSTVKVKSEELFEITQILNKNFEERLNVKLKTLNNYLLK